MFNELSVSTVDPVSVPACNGTKSTAIVQFAPEASVCAPLDVLSCGHVDEESNPKFAEMFGLLPADAGDSVSAALPMFDKIAACGSSVESVVPTIVAVGYTNADWLRSILRT